MSPPLITPLYAGLLALLYVFLSFRIPRLRWRHKVNNGDGDVPELRRAIRAHGNFAEYVPFALILLMMAEWAGYSWWFIHLLGGTLLAARLLHAWGLSRTDGLSPGRFLGTVFTFITIGAAALLVLLHTIGRLLA